MDADQHAGVSRRDPGIPDFIRRTLGGRRVLSSTRRLPASVSRPQFGSGSEKELQAFDGYAPSLPVSEVGMRCILIHTCTHASAHTRFHESGRKQCVTCRPMYAHVEVTRRTSKGATRGQEDANYNEWLEDAQWTKQSMNMQT